MRRIISSVFMAAVVIAVFSTLVFAKDIGNAQKSALVKDEIILSRGSSEHMDLVMCAQAEGSEGGYHPIPMRTLYQIVVDNEERSMQIKFYLKDKSVDPITGYAELIFTKPFEFKLHASKSFWANRP